MTFPFEITSRYEKKYLLEMQKALHKRTAKICTLLSLAGVVLAAVGVVVNESFCIFCGILWTCLFFVLRNQAARKSASETFKSNMKNYGAPVTTTVKFYETMLLAKNETTGSQLKGNYEEVERVIRTQNLAILVLGDNVALMVNTARLSAEDAEDFWDHLRNACRAAEITE